MTNDVKCTNCDWSGNAGVTQCPRCGTPLGDAPGAHATPEQRICIDEYAETLSFAPSQEQTIAEFLTQAGMTDSFAVDLATEIEGGASAFGSALDHDLGRQYRLERELGDETAEIRSIEARDLNIRRRVRMKLLPHAEEHDADSILRFVNEGRLVGGLEHPSIIPVHEIGVDDGGHIFYTTKRLKGETLHDRICAVPHSRTQLLTAFLKVCDAVSFAHANSVVHGSLESAGILVGDYGEVLVADWSTASIATGDDLAAGMRADRQALGRILAQILAGPADGQTEQPVGLAAVVARAMEDHGYSDVAALRADVESWLGGFATTAEDAGFVRQVYLLMCRNKRESAVVLAAMLAIVLSIAVFAVQISRARALAVDNAQLARENAELAKAQAAAAKAALKRLTDTAPVFRDRALQLLKRLRPDQALHLIDQAIQLQPDCAEYHQVRGHVLQTMLKFEQSTRAYQRALALNANMDAAQRNILLNREIVDRRKGGKPRHCELSRLIRELGAQERHPEAELVVRELMKRMDAAEPELRKKLKEAKWRYKLERVTGIMSLQRHGGPAADNLEVIRGMPITHFIYRHQPKLTDISALEGMPLVYLYMTNCGFTDLSPLRDMQLETIIMNHLSGVKDLSPLQGMPLKTLHLYQSAVSDIAPLRGCPLEELVLGFTEVKDLSPLADAPLGILGLSHTRVVDLSPLRKSKVRDLIIVGTDVRDISPLAGVPLHTLRIGYTRVTDISPVKSPCLYRLEIQNTNISDLSPLRGLRLKQILARDSLVHDLAPLKGMKLSTLDISGTLVESIAPLRNMPIIDLKIGRTQVTDVAPLVGMNLNTLDLTDIPVRNIEALFGMPIHTLMLGPNRPPIELLQGLPLKTIGLQVTRPSDLDYIRPLNIKRLFLDFSEIDDLTGFIPYFKGLRALSIAHCPNIHDLVPLRALIQAGKLQELRVDHTLVRDLSPLKGFRLRRLDADFPFITKGIEMARRCGAGKLSICGDEDWFWRNEFWRMYDTRQFDVIYTRGLRERFRRSDRLADE